MPKKFTEYRVFIATPRGLDDERELFRRTLQDYSEETAGRGVFFTPVGWEETLGGVGRSQELINADLITCDYFILVLWDRWGSPTSSELTTGYSSGCEEEFNLALSCLTDPQRPMRQVVVFFKDVEPRAVEDPGAQLQKVLDFRRELERTKKHLFMRFDLADIFQKQLRRFLSQWALEEETSQPQHVEILAKGLKLWNHWRTQHPDIVPNFFRADLRGQYLSGFDLRRANLSRADLSEADLSGANLSGAVLKEPRVQSSLDMRMFQEDAGHV